MATVIGMTAARGEEIAGEHIDSGAVEGTNLVLTRRNAEEITIPGMGGGFTPKWSLLYPTELTLGRTTHTGGVNAGTSSLIPNLWAGSDMGSYTDPIPFIDDDSSYGWAWVDAGWYMTQVLIDARFTANATSPTALPDSMWIDFTTFGGAWLLEAFPVIAPKGNIAGAKSDVLASAIVGPYYQPSWADMLAIGRNQKDAHQLFFRWNGNAVIGGSDGGANPDIQVYSTRVA